MPGLGRDGRTLRPLPIVGARPLARPPCRARPPSTRAPRRAAAPCRSPRPGLPSSPGPALSPTPGSERPAPHPAGGRGADLAERRRSGAATGATRRDVMARRAVNLVAALAAAAVAGLVGSCTELSMTPSRGDAADGAAGGFGGGYWAPADAAAGGGAGRTGGGGAGGAPGGAGGAPGGADAAGSGAPSGAGADAGGGAGTDAGGTGVATTHYSLTQHRSVGAPPRTAGRPRGPLRTGPPCGDQGSVEKSQGARPMARL